MTLLATTLWLLLTMQQDALWAKVGTVVECKPFMTVHILEGRAENIQVRGTRLKCGDEVYRVEEFSLQSTDGKVLLKVDGYEGGKFTLTPMLSPVKMKVTKVERKP